MCSDFDTQHHLPAQPGMYKEILWLIGLGVFLGESLFFSEYMNNEEVG